jgi:hypothetical protein
MWRIAADDDYHTVEGEGDGEVEEEENEEVLMEWREVHHRAALGGVSKLNDVEKKKRKEYFMIDNDPADQVTVTHGEEYAV